MSEQNSNEKDSPKSLGTTAQRLTNVRADIGAIAATKKLGVGSGKYATLNDIMPDINKSCNVFGLCWAFSMDVHPTVPDLLLCTLDIFSTDTQEDTVQFKTVIKPSPAAARLSSEQAMGGTLTYARRYAIMNAFGLSFDDEDLDSPNYGNRGNANQQAPPPQSTLQATPKSTQDFIPVAKWLELKELVFAGGNMTDEKWKAMGKHYNIKSAETIPYKVGEELIKIYNIENFNLRG